MIGSCEFVKCKYLTKNNKCKLGVKNDGLVIICRGFEFDGYYEENEEKGLC